MWLFRSRGTGDVNQPEYLHWPPQARGCGRENLTSGESASASTQHRGYPVTECLQEVGEQCMGGSHVGTWRGAEVDGLVGGMGIEKVGYPGAGEDDEGAVVEWCSWTRTSP